MTATTRKNPGDLPLNPDYGKGCFRRCIRLSGHPGQVIAELEDDCHGFRSTLHHDGERVTDIRGEGLRIPYNTCAGAVEPLRDLIGIAVGADPKHVTETVNPFANCTHLYDLSVLAIAHAARGNVVRQYDVTVTDETDQALSEARVCRDGGEVLHFRIRKGCVAEPEALAGKPLFKGFAAWANDHFEGDEREAAFVLQKGFFVSNGRRYDFRKLDGSRGDAMPNILGACYTYSTGVIEDAYRLDNTIRDFTEEPDQLLRFL